MSEKEVVPAVDERFTRAVEILKVIEQVFLDQSVPMKVHQSRIDALKFLYSEIVELDKLRKQ